MPLTNLTQLNLKAWANLTANSTCSRRMPSQVNKQSEPRILLRRHSCRASSQHGLENYFPCILLRAPLSASWAPANSGIGNHANTRVSRLPTFNLSANDRKAGKRFQRLTSTLASSRRQFPFRWADMTLNSSTFWIRDWDSNMNRTVMIFWKPFLFNASLASTCHWAVPPQKLFESQITSKGSENVIFSVKYASQRQLKRW